MIIAQVCFRLATIKGHSKMCSFITQHNATDVASFKGACNWLWTSGMSTKAVARELNVNLSTISRLQRCYREFGSTSNRPHNRRPRVTTPAQDLHIQQLHLQDRLRPATGQLLQQLVCITKEFLHKLSQGSSSACSSSSSGSRPDCSLLS